MGKRGGEELSGGMSREGNTEGEVGASFCRLCWP